MNDKTNINSSGLGMTKNLMSQKMGEKSLPQRRLKSECNPKEYVKQAD
jgi:hypothetical protein